MKINTYQLLKNGVICISAFMVITSCAEKKPRLSDTFPKKPESNSERKAGRAMLFYEQAEKDLDINDSVIVIPPDERKSKTEE